MLIYVCPVCKTWGVDPDHEAGGLVCRMLQTERDRKNDTD